MDDKHSIQISSGEFTIQCRLVKKFLITHYRFLGVYPPLEGAGGGFYRFHTLSS